MRARDNVQGGPSNLVLVIYHGAFVKEESSRFDMIEITSPVKGRHAKVVLCHDIVFASISFKESSNHLCFTIRRGRCKFVIAS
jgi:hypothetical protein